MKKAAFFLFLFASALFGQEADPYALSAQPTRYVSDPGHRLEDDFRDNLEERLTDYSLKSKNALFVVVLPEGPVQGGWVYADLLGNYWDAAPLWGVLLYVPEEGDGPWASLGSGKGTQFSSVNDLREAAKRVSADASREPEEVEKIAVGVDRLMSEMNFQDMKSASRDERKAEAYEATVRRRQAREFKLRAVLILVGVGALVFLLLAFFLIRRFRRRRRVFQFPETSWRKRLQGPWCGGGNVCHDYGKTGRR